MCTHVAHIAKLTLKADHKVTFPLAGDVARLVEYWSSMHKDLGSVSTIIQIECRGTYP